MPKGNKWGEGPAHEEHVLDEIVLQEIERRNQAVAGAAVKQTRNDVASVVTEESLEK